MKKEVFADTQISAHNKNKEIIRRLQEEGIFKLKDSVSVVAEAMDIRQMPGISCHVPDATFLLFPDITGTGMGSQALVDYLEQTVDLALVPGTEKFFGPGAEGHVRICLATSREVLRQGLDRLERGLRLLADRR